MTKVYGNVMICSVICAAGMYMNAYTVFSGFIMSIAVVMGMAYLMFKVTDHMLDENTRMGYLWALAFSLGFMVGPAMHHIAEVDASILINAAIYTSILFGSFSGVALFSKRRSYLFLGGIISSVLSALFWYRMMSWMTGYGFHMDSLSYIVITLFVACMYVIYDTQCIIELAERHNDKDVPKHTMILFMDLFDLFIKIVQLLMELEKGKKKKRDD